MSTNSLLLEELGRTQTVKDVEAAYRQIMEAKRQFAVRVRHARERNEQSRAEMECFLDDLQHITGLELNSPLFIRLATMTIGKRLERRNLTEDFEQSFMNGW